MGGKAEAMSWVPLASPQDTFLATPHGPLLPVGARSLGCSSLLAGFLVLCLPVCPPTGCWPPRGTASSSVFILCLAPGICTLSTQ